MNYINSINTTNSNFRTLPSVQFANQNNIIPSDHLPEGYDNAVKNNQQMLQERARAIQEVEEGQNNESVRAITRKKNNRWTPDEAKKRANALAKELHGSSRRTKRKQRHSKKTNRRKTRRV